MKYDYFAFIFDKHKNTVERVLHDFGNNNVVYEDYKAKWFEGRGKSKRLIKEVNLKPLADEPIKVHLLFDVLKKGRDSSWRNILTEFYKRKVNDLNNNLRRELLTVCKKDYSDSLCNVFCFKIKIVAPFFTASENKFYSIGNPIAKEKPTGLPILKGSSLKGALRQAAIDVVESELMEKNYGEKFVECANDSISSEEVSELEERETDRFFFRKRAQLVKLFGNEKDMMWFTFKSLLATGGIKDVRRIKDILEKISNAFEHYLRKNNIINSEGARKGRLIFEDLYFRKVALDVITPLDRRKRTPTLGPIFYEVVPKDESIDGKLIWFPFDLITQGRFEDIDSEWERDKELIRAAFGRLSEKGIGAKTKIGCGRFTWEEINEP